MQKKDTYIGPELAANKEGTKPSHQDIPVMSQVSCHYLLLCDMLEVRDGIFIQVVPTENSMWRASTVCSSSVIQKRITQTKL